MKSKTIFETDNLYYIYVTKELISDYLNMVNDPDVSKYISRHEKKFNEIEEELWINEKLNSKAECFSIIEKHTNKFVGNIEIVNIKNNIGEIGISITSDMQNKHYGREAIKGIIEYESKNLKLDGFDLYVFNDNERAIKCYEYVGFVKDERVYENGDIHMIYSNIK